MAGAHQQSCVYSFCSVIPYCLVLISVVLYLDPTGALRCLSLDVECDLDFSL